MHTLYILRHADAERTPPGKQDIDRQLSEKGRQSCKIIAETLRLESIRPDFILCSTAIRTRQTLECISHVWSDMPEVRFEENIYEAHTENIRAAITRSATQHQDIMVIGHNPGLQTLTLELANAPGATAYKQALSDFSPGCLAKLYGDDNAWLDLYPGKFTFLKFYRP